MNFLRKILTIAIVSLTTDISGMQLPAPPVAAAAVGGHVLDFDTIANINDNIPAIFQPKIYHPAGYQAGGPNNLKYVYFAIPQNGVIANVAFLRPINNTPPANINYNIYFPADGSQPTTPDAVNYSLANIDNTPNSPITEWYIQMFGVRPFQNAGAPGPNDYIKAGWIHPASGGGAISAQRIISLDEGSMVHVGCSSLCSYNHISAFRALFRQIASNPVGRILLYRLLVEIRRHNGVGNGVSETGIQQSTIRNNRNKNRSISIIKTRQNNWNFYPSEAIEFANNKGALIPTVTTSGQALGKTRELCIALFHEMLHWYHCLRDYDRFNAETSLLIANNANNPILAYYFGNQNPNALNSTWSQEGGKRVAVEDMRTILGVVQNVNGQNGVNINGFLNGDDISENLFRCALNHQNVLTHKPKVYMRYGGSIEVSDATSYNVIQLAHRVVFTAMFPIIANAAGNWHSGKGGAFAP